MTMAKQYYKPVEVLCVCHRHWVTCHYSLNRAPCGALYSRSGRLIPQGCDW